MNEVVTFLFGAGLVLLICIVVVSWCALLLTDEVYDIED